jgi:hypothetical protein
LLFSGKTSIFSFKYSILNDIVKKLKQWSISVGNIITFNKCNGGTSETLRDETVVQTENVKPISVHVPTHLKPLNDHQFGHYLAGLIDGDGHFSRQQQLVIAFHSLDASLAYYLKKRLGFGNIKKVKNKNAFLLVIAARKGLEKVINLINGKIRTENKFNQIWNNILNNVNFKQFEKSLNFSINKNKDLKNYWLAGFADADASFQIKVIKSSKTEIRLNFQIDQKTSPVLLLIKEFIGGNIGFRKNQDRYYYGSTSFGSAKNVINYFDYFHLLSSKHINYLKWRKAYLIIQNKNHLNKVGIERIIKYKNTMNRLSDTTV